VVERSLYCGDKKVIDKVFSVPVYQDLVSNKSAIDQEIALALTNSEFANVWQPDNDTANTTFIPGKQANILAKHQLKATVIEIVRHANAYLEGTGQPYKKNSVKIDQSWLNTFEDNQLIGLHEHGYQPNTISGVYYHKAPQNCGRLILKNHNPFVVSFPHQSQEFFNLVNIEPEEGLVVFFPSWLMHKVEPNKTKETRVSLSFNISFDYTFYE
jgi:uncharacterized protein (TIGR02466 family)